MTAERSPGIRRLCEVVVAIALGNFLVFFAVAVVIGGDAVNGHAEAGRFFLASHGKLTETTQAVFTYSRLHVYSLWITHPLGMLAGLFCRKWRKRA